MKREIVKRSLMIVIVLFTLTLAAPLVLLKGLNRDRLERRSAEIAASFRQYVQSQNDVVAYITSDTVVRSGPMQFLLGNGLGLLQKHLNALNDNFNDLKLIALYEKTGQLFLATDYDLAPGRIDPAAAINLKTRKYEIFYVPNYNQYALSVTTPLMNQFNFRIGYVRCFFTLKSFLAGLRLGRDFRLFLEKDGAVVALSAEASTTGLAAADGVKLLRQDGTLWISKSSSPDQSGIRFIFLYRYYNSLFMVIVGVNILLAVLLVGLVTALLAGVRRAAEDREFKKTADEVLSYTQKTLREVHVLDDMVSQLKLQKEDLKTQIDRLQVGSTASASKGSYDFKIIEPL